MKMKDCRLLVMIPIKMFEKLLLQDISKTVQKCKKMEVIARLKILMGYISIQVQYYLRNPQNGSFIMN